MLIGVGRVLIPEPFRPNLGEMEAFSEMLVGRC